jgi:tRNA(fMet)-specific endonuclease VapC
MHLLDGNACLDFLLGREPGIASRIERAFGSLIVSSITAAELRADYRASENPDRGDRRIDIFLEGIRVASFDARAADLHRSMMRALPVRRTNFDRLTAAHCLAPGATLVTDHEPRFANVPGLLVENWAR